jgi:hypothetical protein
MAGKVRYGVVSSVWVCYGRIGMFMLGMFGFGKF